MHEQHAGLGERDLAVLRALIEFDDAGEPATLHELATRTGRTFAEVLKATEALRSAGLIRMNVMRGDDQVVAGRVTHIAQQARDVVEGVVPDKEGEDDTRSTSHRQVEWRFWRSRTAAIVWSIFVVISIMLGFAADIKSFLPDSGNRTSTPTAPDTDRLIEPTTAASSTVPSSSLSMGPAAIYWSELFTIPRGLAIRPSENAPAVVGVRSIEGNSAVITIATDAIECWVTLGLGESTAPGGRSETEMWIHIRVVEIVDNNNGPYVRLEGKQGTGTKPAASKTCQS